MKGPNDLGGLSSDEKRLAARLEKEIEEHFRGTPKVIYEFSPSSIGAAEFSDRVKHEVIKRARAVGWTVSELDSEGGFTVQGH